MDDPLWVEHPKEVGASDRLLGFADRFGHAPQTVQAPKETGIRWVGPPDVAGSLPAVLAQGIKTAVVTNPEVGVRFDPRLLINRLAFDEFAEQSPHRRVIRKLDSNLRGLGSGPQGAVGSLQPRLQFSRRIRQDNLGRSI